MKTGIELISEERQEQLNRHGRSIAHDILYNDKKQLSDAASILALDFPHICLEQDEVEESHKNGS